MTLPAGAFYALWAVVVLLPAAAIRDSFESGSFLTDSEETATPGETTLTKPTVIIHGKTKLFVASKEGFRTEDKVKISEATQSEKSEKGTIESIGDVKSGGFYIHLKEKLSTSYGQGATVKKVPTAPPRRRKSGDSAQARSKQEQDDGTHQVSSGSPPSHASDATKELDVLLAELEEYTPTDISSSDPEGMEVWTCMPFTSSRVCATGDSTKQKASDAVAVANAEECRELCVRKGAQCCEVKADGKSCFVVTSTERSVLKLKNAQSKNAALCGRQVLKAGDFVVVAGEIPNPNGGFIQNGRTGEISEVHPGGHESTQTAPYLIVDFDTIYGHADTVSVPKFKVLEQDLWKLQLRVNAPRDEEAARIKREQTDLFWEMQAKTDPNVRTVLYDYNPKRQDSDYNTPVDAKESNSDYSTPGEETHWQDEAELPLKAGAVVKIVKIFNPDWVRVVQLSKETMEEVTGFSGRFPVSYLSGPIYGSSVATSPRRVGQVSKKKKKSAQAFEVGRAYVAVNEMSYFEDPHTGLEVKPPYVLGKGSGGDVQEVDAAGNAQIKFDGEVGLKWVAFKDLPNFNKLDELEESKATKPLPQPPSSQKTGDVSQHKARMRRQDTATPNVDSDDIERHQTEEGKTYSVESPVTKKKKKKKQAAPHTNGASGGGTEEEWDFSRRFILCNDKSRPKYQANGVQFLDKAVPYSGAVRHLNGLKEPFPANYCAAWSGSATQQVWYLLYKNGEEVKEEVESTFREEIANAKRANAKQRNSPK